MNDYIATYYNPEKLEGETEYLHGLGLLPVDTTFTAQKSRTRVQGTVQSAPFEEFGMHAERTHFVADECLRADGFENIFVGGDCQTGPKSAIMAIGAGKVAARNIDEYLGFHHTLDPCIEAPEPRPNVREAYGRVNVPERLARERGKDFDHIELPLSEEEIMQECSRCLRCDVYGCGVLEGGRITYV